MRVVLAILAPVVMLPVPVRAEGLSPAQRRCVVLLNRADVRAASAGEHALLGCIHRLARGRAASGETLAECAARGSRTRVARLRARVERATRRACAMAPPFGASLLADEVAAFATMLQPQAVFGPTLIRARTDPAGARCQAAIARGIARLGRARVEEFTACKAAGLRAGTIADAGDLAGCLGSDAHGRIARAMRAARRIAVARCRATPVASACPAECTRVPLAGLSECLGRRVACDFCLAATAADALPGSCQRYREGVTDPYCGPRPVTAQSVARQWDEEALAAVRLDTPRPTVHARNLFHVSVAMWDAWAAYDPTASGYLVREKRTSNDVVAERATAISFAAYRVLAERYARAPRAAETRAALDARMLALGYDQDFTSVEGASAAALGNRIAAAVIAYGLGDGSNEQGIPDYDDPTYVPVNAPLIVKLPGTVMVDPNRWQPLALDLIITQNGIQLPDKVQKYVGAGWESVTPFALTRSDANDVYLDPGPPPWLGGDGDADFKAMNVDLVRLSSELTPDDPTTIDISPAVHGNLPVDADGAPLPTDVGSGYGVNPVTGAPYAPNVVRRADWGRVIAEFWADGPNSETPPGHWNVIANYVSDHGEKRFGGTGARVDDLEWDVKLYLAVNGAVHDAAIACWGIKRHYDSVRPISAVRYMGGHGALSDPMRAELGLPLVDGLVELIDSTTTAPGGRHEALAGHEGEIAILAWPGQPDDPLAQYSGARWILAVDWVPYQKKTFVTPAFASYPSGHSTFSRAAAEVLARFTGSAYFPGGLGEFVAPKDRFLTFERGPSADVALQWVSYFDAANEAGISRRLGGIHIVADDYAGRRIGHRVGIAAFEKAARLFAGQT